MQKREKETNSLEGKGAKETAAGVTPSRSTLRSFVLVASLEQPVRDGGHVSVVLLEQV